MIVWNFIENQDSQCSITTIDRPGDDDEDDEEDDDDDDVDVVRGGEGETLVCVGREMRWGGKKWRDLI